MSETQLGLSDPSPKPAGIPLSRRRKAAMVIQLLLAEGQKLSLSSLPEDQQIALTRELSALRVVDKTTLNRVAEEFATELEEVGFAAAGTVAGTIAALQGQISPAAIARLRDEEARRAGSDPWSQILGQDPADLVPLFEKESTEVCAVALSKLPVSKAAAILGLLPGETARRITYSMSQTAAVTPDAVQRIGQSLAQDYGSRPAMAFITPPSQRVGAILNSSQTATRNAMLDGLTAEDPAFAEQVRKSIFTFPDIPSRVPPNDVSKVIRGVDSAALILALAGAQGDGGAMADAAEFMLSNMSTRMAESLRDEIAEKGRVKKADAESAQAQIIAEIRARADAGEITLIVPDDED